MSELSKLDLQSNTYWRTRDRRKAYVSGKIPSANIWVGVVLDGTEYIERSWDENGRVGGGSYGSDLVAPWKELVRVIGWVNVYGHPPAMGCIYKTLEQANKVSDCHERIACIYIDIMEGTGLDV